MYTIPWWDKPVDAFIPFILTCLAHFILLQHIQNKTYRCQSRFALINWQSGPAHLCTSLQTKQATEAPVIQGCSPSRAEGSGYSTERAGSSWLGNKKQGHWSQSQPQHGGVTLVTNENHPASLCYTQVKQSLSCACFVSQVKTVGDGLSATMWPQLEEYRKHCLSIHSWCHQTYSRCEFGTVTQIPECNWGLLLTVSDCCTDYWLKWCWGEKGNFEERQWVLRSLPVKTGSTVWVMECIMLWV